MPNDAEKPVLDAQERHCVRMLGSKAEIGRRPEVAGPGHRPLLAPVPDTGSVGTDGVVGR